MVKSSKTTVWHLYPFFFQFIFLIFRWHATDCWSLSFDERCHRIVTSRNGRHFFGLESWSSWLFSYWNHCQYSTVQGKLSSIFKNNGILLPKLFWPTVRKNCSSDREKLFKFEAEQFIRQWKVRTVFGKRMLFNSFLEVSHI